MKKKVVVGGGPTPLLTLVCQDFRRLLLVDGVDYFRRQTALGPRSHSRNLQQPALDCCQTHCDCHSPAAYKALARPSPLLVVIRSSAEPIDVSHLISILRGARIFPGIPPVSSWCTRSLHRDGQLSARIRGLLDGIDKAMEFNRGIERRQAVLPGPDCLGEQGIHLPDIERITTGEGFRDI